LQKSEVYIARRFKRWLMNYRLIYPITIGQCQLRNIKLQIQQNLITQRVLIRT